MFLHSPNFNGCFVLDFLFEKKRLGLVDVEFVGFSFTYVSPMIYRTNSCYAISSLLVFEREAKDCPTIFHAVIYHVQVDDNSIIYQLLCSLLAYVALYFALPYLTLSICIPYKHFPVTHWGRVTHICVGTNTNIGSDNGLSPGRRQAIIWTNPGILLIGPQGTNFSGILSEIHTFSFKKIHLKMSSGKWRPFCLGLNVLSLVFIRWVHQKVIC